MLIEFSVENFKSYSKMVTLSLEASSSKELPDNVIYDAEGTGINLLKSAVIYGANASGKSNLIEALSFMAHFVVDSLKSRSKKTPTGVTPFKLDACRIDQPSVFEVAFISDGVKYLYGFSLDKSKVHQEWLYSYPHNRKRLLFERYFADKNKKYFPYHYKFGEYWSGEAKKLTRLTRTDSLFISTASQFNHPLADIVYEWFSLYLRRADALPQGMSEELFTIKLAESNEKVKNSLLGYLKHADLGIIDFDLRRVPIIESRIFRTMPGGLEIPDFIKKDVAKSIEEEDEPTIPEVITYRTGYNETGESILVPFQFEEESHGTQKYFILAGPLMYVISTGSCLISDELDIQLHPILSRNIIETFHNPKVNKKNAQLIFATHDVSLIENRKIFRRDQIWFAHKDSDGSTELFSAWDFKARKNENVGRGYLAGRYGAIPFIEEIIGEEDF